MNNQKIKYGIALSGGGARGLTHIGVLAALEENGIEPEIIAGTSMGALVGTFYAAGFSPQEMLDIALHEKFRKVFMTHVGKGGLVSMDKTREFIRKHLNIYSFEGLKKKLYISAANISKGHGEVFSTGQILEPLLASMAIPILFEPQLINNEVYVDGGLFDNLPVQSLLGKCDYLIGSHVNHFEKNQEINGLKAVADSVYNLAIYQNVHKNLSHCDLFIDPPEVRKYGMFNFSHTKELYDIGYNETINALQKSVSRKERKVEDAKKAE